MRALGLTFREVVLTFVLVTVIVSVATDVRAVGQAVAIAIGGASAVSCYESVASRRRSWRP